MKKIWIAAVLFVLVFAVEFLLRRYSLIWAENLSLFLFTPDYFSRVFSEPFPVFHLFKSFLLQFFGLHPTGPAIVALLISSLYLLVCSLFSMLQLGKSKYFAIVLASAVFLSVAVSALTPASRRYETYCKVMVSTKYHDWNTVASVATPSVCEKNRDLLPFALLALQNKGILKDNMFKYPVRQISDLDYHGTDMLTGAFFEAVLAESLGVPNEAVHKVFQLNCGRPYGTCFLSLHLLVRNTIAQGDADIARKYAEVLARSPRFASEARWILSTIKDGEPVQQGQTTSGKALLVDKNPILTLYLIAASGRNSKSLTERMTAYQLLDQRFNKPASPSK